MPLAPAVCTSIIPDRYTFKMNDNTTQLGLEIDLDRVHRCGFPEVVFGEGKTADAVVAAVTTLRQAHQNVLVTRVSPKQAEAVLISHTDIQHSTTARALRWNNPEQPDVGRVVVVTAGTGDVPVAEEAMETLRWMNVGCELICDVGVAGPQRLLSRVDELQSADAIVCVAGMEAALASVIGGWVSCPVVAVPTSVGYGASLGGIAALLGMLNSCAANVSVVNIDAGFKAAFVAGLIATKANR